MGFSCTERSPWLPTAVAGRSRSMPTCAPSWLVVARWVGVGRGRQALLHTAVCLRCNVVQSCGRMTAAASLFLWYLRLRPAGGQDGRLAPRHRCQWRQRDCCAGKCSAVRPWFSCRHPASGHGAGGHSGPCTGLQRGHPAPGCGASWVCPWLSHCHPSPGSQGRVAGAVRQ